MTDEPQRRTPLVTYGVLVAVFGVASGLAAIVLTWVLHTVEELVYGHGEAPGRVLTDGVDPWRSSLAVAGVALLLGPAWWALRRWAPDLIGVAGMVEGRRAPVLATSANAVLQMIGVGAGLPVGREVAPRELAGMITSRISTALGVDAAAHRVLTAAAAGAALGAVYQVPLAGAIFTIELLLKELSTRIVATCLAMAAIAVAVSRLYISPHPQYMSAQVDSTDVPTLAWAVVVGLLLGPLGAWFGAASSHVKRHSQRGTLTLVTLPLVGLGVAVLAFWQPLVLGNGRSAAQAAFLGVGLGVAAVTLVGKLAATLLTLRAGAVGGTLAPAIAGGALGGTVIAHLATLVGLDAPAPTLAVLGAAAVLATSLRGPATGMLMVIGVTGQPHDAYLAVALAVGAGFGTAAVWNWVVARVRAAGQRRPRS